MGALRSVALVFGIGFLAAGILGFVPAFTPGGNLLGYFEVDSMHNIVHIASGVIALFACSSAIYAKWYFRIFGILYGIAAIAGFVRAGDLYMMHVNMADNILHLVIAVIALYLGFVYKSVRSS